MYNAYLLSPDGPYLLYTYVNGSMLLIVLKCSKNLFSFYDKDCCDAFELENAPLSKLSFPSDVNILYSFEFIREVF